MKKGLELFLILVVVIGCVKKDVTRKTQSDAIT